LVAETIGSHGVDTIVHFAAESHVDRSIHEPAAFIRTNVAGTQVLLDAARTAWCRDGRWRDDVRFHHVSTDEVYGSLGPDDPAFSERTPYAPSSPYAASKAASDHLVRAYQHTYGLPASISNCSNNYGPYQFPEKLVPLMIVNALGGLPLPIYGDGQQVRDWLFVEDHCAAIDRIVGADVSGRTFNVGGRAERKNVDLVSQLCRLIDLRFAADAMLPARFPDCPAAHGRSCESLMQSVTDRPGHDRRYAIDPTCIATELRFEPRHTLESGLAVTVDWYLANESWWRAVMDGSYRGWMERQYGHASRDMGRG
jgi:dTDP-glucose 4,6-dehydratase